MTGPKALSVVEVGQMEMSWWTVAHVKFWWWACCEKKNDCSSRGEEVEDEEQGFHLFLISDVFEAHKETT